MNAIVVSHQDAASTASFIHDIIGDSTSPTYAAGRHAVICVPVAGYTYEGVYLINRLELYRCQREGRYVRMSRDNKLYSEFVTTSTFSTAPTWRWSARTSES